MAYKCANLPPESFSIPTDIYIDTSSRYIIEDTIYEPEFHHIYDEIAKENLYLHDGKITISKKIFVQTKDDFTLKGYFTFQTCDDNHCLPPYDGEFEFKVNGCDFQDYSPPLTSKENQPETKAGSEKKVNFENVKGQNENKIEFIENDKRKTEKIITCYFLSILFKWFCSTFNPLCFSDDSHDS